MSAPTVPTIPPLVEESYLSELQNEFDVLHLIYLRSKNQFRSSTWWSSLQIYHKSLRNIITLANLHKQHLANLASGLTSFQKLKKKLQFFNTYNDKHLKKLQTKFNYGIKHFVKIVVPNAWRQFHNIIAMGQFITLGFALIASLGKSFAIVNSLYIAVFEREAQKNGTKASLKSNIDSFGSETNKSYFGPDSPKKLVATRNLQIADNLVVDEDLGQEILPSDLAGDVVGIASVAAKADNNLVLSVTMNKKKKKKSKKDASDNSSFLDNLFGKEEPQGTAKGTIARKEVKSVSLDLIPVNDSKTKAVSTLQSKQIATVGSTATESLNSSSNPKKRKTPSSSFFDDLFKDEKQLTGTTLTNEKPKKSKKKKNKKAKTGSTDSEFLLTSLFG